ncbi:MAG: pyridoxamine 5'-phosphate oxidase family protein [Deltaproteobacteria bacterium]|nr:pyridoxamine 5'-phosphate oxidase family protein [Deltaproteobacteria bacterium]
MDKAQKEALKKKILAMCDHPTVAVLATVTEDNRPWARYMAPVADENLDFRMPSNADSRKVAHIKNNPKVHLTTGVTDMETAAAYIQVEGKAEILCDKASRHAFWDEHLMRFFSGPDDPNYCVIKIIPQSIEYQSVGPVPPEVWERD